MPCVKLADVFIICLLLAHFSIQHSSAGVSDREGIEQEEKNKKKTQQKRIINKLSGFVR